MTQTRTNTQTIADEVTSWPGIEIDSDEPGELAFKLGRREIGHLHGEHVAHFSFPKQTWDELWSSTGSSRIRCSPTSGAPRRAASTPTTTSATSSRSCGSTTTASLPAES